MSSDLVGRGVEVLRVEHAELLADRVDHRTRATSRRWRRSAGPRRRAPGGRRSSRRSPPRPRRSGTNTVRRVSSNPRRAARNENTRMTDTPTSTTPGAPSLTDRRRAADGCRMRLDRTSSLHANTEISRHDRRFRPILHRYDDRDGTVAGARSRRPGRRDAGRVRGDAPALGDRGADHDGALGGGPAAGRRSTTSPACSRSAARPPRTGRSSPSPRATGSSASSPGSRPTASPRSSRSSPARTGSSA